MTAEGAMVCAGCERRIEVCAFCDEVECGVAICYRCLIFEVGESVAHPHRHGG